MISNSLVGALILSLFLFYCDRLINKMDNQQDNHPCTSLNTPSVGVLHESCDILNCSFSYLLFYLVCSMSLAMLSTVIPVIHVLVSIQHSISWGAP
jgi:hypothetical protein